jgi:acetyl esterase/lipase
MTAMPSSPDDEDLPPFLLPFVLPVEPVEPLRDGAIDWYLPPDDPDPGRLPAVVFVHGGPVPPWLEPKPREWPSYRAYGAWAARAGFVGVTFDHGFESYETFDVAIADIAQAIEAAQAHPHVDPDRIVLWGFSGAGMLLGPWVDESPAWLRGVAASYPCCRPLEDAPSAPIALADAVADAGELPILLTRVGLEEDEIAETVTGVIVAAESVGAALDVIDVPHGHHGFDQVDPGEESQEAVRAAMSWVSARLTPH